MPTTPDAVLGTERTKIARPCLPGAHTRNTICINNYLYVIMMSDLENTTGAWSSRSTQCGEQGLEYGRGERGKLKSQFFCLDWDGMDAR